MRSRTITGSVERRIAAWRWLPDIGTNQTLVRHDSTLSVGACMSDLATLIECNRDIESRKHSAKRPRIRPVRLPEENNGARAKSVCLLKYLLRPLRSCSRARHSRAFTAVSLTLSTSAVWSMVSPSISRSTKTVRKMGLSSSRHLIRMSRSSDAQ